jgi:hypothetical protein
MASVARSPYRNKGSLSDPRHLSRWLKEQAGMEIKAIAAQEHVSEKTVRESIAQVELHRKKNTSFEMDLALRNVIIDSAPVMKDTLHGLLTATEMVEQKDHKTGNIKIVKQEDKITRIEAVRLVTSLAATMQPKVPTVQNNVSATAQVAATVTASETNEERFRRLQADAKAFNALPPKVAGVPDHIDAGDDADDGDEDDDEEEDEE